LLLLTDGTTLGARGERLRVHDAFIVRYDAEKDILFYFLDFYFLFFPLLHSIALLTVQLVPSIPGSALGES
tara:strand:+ start:175 stop:387 length:213 start_codon:yes stop_codon:yes gene_type:complete